jgi:polysaccharide biosynthesis protein VpsJ
MAVTGYAHLYAATRDESAAAEARRRLEWLDRNHADTRHGRGWGYHFDVQTRFFFYGRNSPNTIATSFVARAFLDAAALLGEERWAEAALDASNFLLEEMLVSRPRGPFFRYIPGDEQVVHNANLLACEVLARTAKAVGGEPRLEQAVTEALDTTLRAQRADGSWPYAEEDQHGWVDNFHTGYVLESLAASAHLHDDAPERLDAGVDFWARAMFLPDGRPKYFPDKVRPFDAHNYAQAIPTWLSVADRKPEAWERAEHLAELLIEDLLAPSGYVLMEPRRRLSNTVPFIRWTTAPTFAALAALLAHREHAALRP